MKLAAILLGFWGICSVAPAVPTAPLIYGGRTELVQSVTPTGSFIDLGPDTRKSAGAVPGLAAKLDRKRIFRWSPSQISGPMGGADVTDAALSPDGTVLCIAERIGGAGNFNSTRLVLLSPHKGLLNAQMLEDVRVLRLGFLPERKGQIWALAESGRNDDPARFLLIYDLIQQKLAVCSKPLPAATGEILPVGTSLWLTSPTDGTLLRYATNALQKGPERLSIRIVSPILTEQDGKLLVLGEGEGAFFASPNGKTVQTGILQLPAGLRPIWCQPMPGQAETFAMVTADGRGGILAAGKFSALQESNAAPGWLFSAGKKLIFGDRKQEIWHPFSLPALEPEKAVKPGKERPETRNRTFRTFALPGENPTLLQLDDRGNVFAIRLERRRIRKTPVLIVDRTGFR